MSNPERPQDKNFTKTPNMLIYGYHHISPQEKWLYTCLEHMCGKSGTRYLALRYISEQTGISTGALSKSKNKQGVVNEGMIRHLHDAGLIHAEVKKKEGKGNALYHITITDVWALNQAFFLERNKTRSDFGQDENETSEPVRNSDEPVQLSDKLVQNSDAPVRKPVQLQDIYKTTNKTIKQEGVTEDSAIATSSPAFEETYIPEFDYLTSEQEAAPLVQIVEHETLLRVTDNLLEKSVAMSAAISEQSQQDSYSPETVATAPGKGGYEKTEEPEKPKKRSRKPAAPKVDENEVEMYLDVFDELYCEVTGDPELGYDRTGVSREAVTNLLKNNLTKPRFVTPDKLRAVYRSLFKKPKDEQTGFCWAENMSIKAVCRNYAKEAMALTVQAQQKQQKPNTPPATKKPSLTEDLRAKEAYYNAKRGVAL